jgi:integrase
MMDTGCRPGEVLALRWEDILWDLGVIFVRRSKTKKSIRYVPMSDRARDRLAVRVEASGRTGYVFPSTRSKAKHVTRSCLSKEFRRVRDLLGQSNIFCYRVSK